VHPAFGPRCRSRRSIAAAKSTAGDRLPRPVPHSRCARPCAGASSTSSHGGALDLRGQSFAVLGAGAELAATRVAGGGCASALIDLNVRVLASRGGLVGLAGSPAGAPTCSSNRAKSPQPSSFADAHGPVNWACSLRPFDRDGGWGRRDVIATHQRPSWCAPCRCWSRPRRPPRCSPSVAQPNRLLRPARWKSALLGPGAQRSRSSRGERRGDRARPFRFRA
jgi:hypothetical protein